MAATANFNSKSVLSYYLVIRGRWVSQGHSGLMRQVIYDIWSALVMYFPA